MIRADIKYVDDRDHIVFKQENTSNANFTFNAASHQFVSNVVLQIGSNTFEITGTNQYGSDVKSTIVIYKREPKILFEEICTLIEDIDNRTQLGQNAIIVNENFASPKIAQMVLDFIEI